MLRYPELPLRHQQDQSTEDHQARRGPSGADCIVGGAGNDRLDGGVDATTAPTG
jgi:hypothetical protein